ncbi:MAG: putative sulfate exporter family transporter [Nostoc sp.]|uniref:putative sulfate exporter family transporter n=1 Tax=Nostoc sp. TaxID=1180 RepID=UPI002FF80BFD
MTIDQLQIFLAVAQHLHFTRAAEELYITQPSVSAAIQSLEEQYGVKLFNQVGRRIELTLAGNMLQVEAQKILTQIELSERGLRELNDLKRGELKLGASQTIGNYWLPRFISLFKQEYPNISVDCTLGNTTEISEGKVTGLFDLSLVEGEVEPSVLASLEQQIVGGDCLQIVVGQSHPWFEKMTVEVTELTNTAWVIREKGSGTRQQSKSGDVIHKPQVPWFIGLFILASVVRTFIPEVASWSSVVTHVSEAGLTLTLFLIGAGLSQRMLKAVGWKPMLQGVPLWIFINATSLGVILLVVR